ncbi:MAG TPA: chromate efflux transporter [Myxococcaceae bacterium]|nr:chromate efflux transporter [Myxococcaceae bacterium]
MPAPIVSISQLVRVFFRIGWLAFGGPVAQLGLMHDECVERRRWIEDADFVRALNFVHVLPGPEASQMAIFIGWRVLGVLGGVLAGVLFISPGIITLAALAAIYVRYGSRPELVGVLSGFRPVALALLAAAMLRLSKTALRTPFQKVLAVLAFGASVFLHVGFVALLLGCGAVSILRSRLRGSLAAMALLSIVASARAEAAAPALERLRDVSLFFLKVGLVSFGGAYAVLPLLREGAVLHSGWITDPQMVDALALGETTPGPLISIGVFIGYLAGHPLGVGLSSALCAGFWLFLPSFVLVLVGAPHLDRITAWPGVQPFLQGVTAGVLALMAAVSLALAQATVIHAGRLDWVTLVLGIVAFVVLVVGGKRVNVAYVVLAGGAVGLVRAFLGA